MIAIVVDELNQGLIRLLILFELHYIRHISSKVYQILSDYPSIYEWKVILKCSLVPKTICKLFQNMDVNYVSLTKIIEIGKSMQTHNLFHIKFS